MARPAHLALLAVLPLLAAGCTYGDSIDAYPTESGTSKDCDALYADLPNVVAGETREDIKDDLAAVWGDPQIILRCGVEKPEALTRTSRCDDVAGVGWLTEKTSDGLQFTTIGRQFFISVEVPKDYDPPADALVDLAESVEKHDPDVQPCV